MGPQMGVPGKPWQLITKKPALSTMVNIPVPRLGSEIMEPPSFKELSSFWQAAQAWRLA